jgi:hypothetical protein
MTKPQTARIEINEGITVHDDHTVARDLHPDAEQAGDQGEDA